jgi:hypothetical protein
MFYVWYLTQQNGCMLQLLGGVLVLQKCMCIGVCVFRPLPDSWQGEEAERRADPGRLGSGVKRQVRCALGHMTFWCWRHDHC